MDSGTAIFISGMMPTITMLVTYVLGRMANKRDKKETDEKIQAVHVLVNSGLTQLVAATDRAATAEGIIKGTADEKERAAAAAAASKTKIKD